MARTDTTDGQALRQLGGTEDSRFREGDRQRLAYDDEVHTSVAFDFLILFTKANYSAVSYASSLSLSLSKFE